MRDEQDERHHAERDDDRADRHGDAQPLRLREPPLDPDHSATPPAISRPSSSTVAVARVELADDRALVHDDDPVGEREDLVEILAR